MSAKRFYTSVSVGQAEGGFGVLLDGRPVRTPAKAPLTLPVQALAEALAAEWADQDDRIRPETMRLTRLANTALDRIGGRRGEVVDEITAYGGTDLLCYRAEAPDELVIRQAETWDPWLDWSAAALGARLLVTTGLMHVTQPDPALTALRGAVEGWSDLALAPLHELTTVGGSLVLALALAEGRLPVDEAFAAAHLDELYQEAEWGADAEAAARRRVHLADLQAAARFLVLLGDAARV